MTHKNNVKSWYSFLNARWYDPFRYLWTKLVSERAEQEFLRILKKNIKPSSEILELGCGTGINIGRIKGLKFKNYTGIDFTQEMLDIARKRYGKIKNLYFKQGDITKKIDNKKYDVIISTWVISHLTEPSKVINECYSKLNKGGILVFVFFTKPDWYFNIWTYPFVRLFAAEYVTDKEIKKIKAKKKITRYAANSTTLLEIRKRL